jgi:transposase
MSKWKLYNVAKRYVQVIEKMEHTSDPQRLVELEEERGVWHDRMLRILKREGIPFKDREHVTRIAFHIARGD